jgi:5,10-methylenetetrahydromethanopterin reductase
VGKLDVGINLNGDISFKRLVETSALTEVLGYSNIWVGESIHFKHPFPVITSIANSTKSIQVGSGIISYFFNRSLHIKKAFETLVEAYGERFAITLAPGDVNSLRKSGIEFKSPLKKLKVAIEDIRSSKILKKTPVYVGASGPKMIETGSLIADGILLNYAHPEYVEWALSHVKNKTYVGVYAPALLTPDLKNEKAGLLASAFVAAGSNPVFQENFNIKREINEIKEIIREKKYENLKAKKDFLYERFLITGDQVALKERIKEFQKLGVDQLILGSPFNYNLKAIKALGSSGSL